MLKIRSIYYRLPIRRTMDQEHLDILEALHGEMKRIADTLERLLKVSEMRP